MREEGNYWVKWRGIKRWIIAEWQIDDDLKNGGCWLLGDPQKDGDGWSDEDMDEIYEIRIKDPDEQ